MPKNLCLEAKRQWETYWDDAAASVQTAADRGVLLRWIDAVDRYVRTIKEADLNPIVYGSKDQQVPNPLYKVAADSLGTIERCEKQLGIGALNRANLGIAVISGQRSLAEMNSEFGGDDNYSDDEDPRLQIEPS
jgi:P27 family predicted phage terminase small subunit